MMPVQVAALFVETNGVYFGLDGVDPWDVTRDARLYNGPHPVVAHPPCERWGRYWSGGPNPKAKRFSLGDDGGCFEAALHAVRHWGGVLEHPEASHAFGRFQLPRPPRCGSWIQEYTFELGGPQQFVDGRHAWTCCVEQGHYGHPARKATWLYYVSHTQPPDLIWGNSRGARLDEGFHSREERERARAAGRKPIKRLSTKQNITTPIAFRDLLISLARSA